jgi:hypothetical protein
MPRPEGEGGCWGTYCNYLLDLEGELTAAVAKIAALEELGQQMYEALAEDSPLRAQWMFRFAEGSRPTPG